VGVNIPGENQGLDYHSYPENAHYGSGYAYAKWGNVSP